MQLERRIDEVQTTNDEANVFALELLWYVVAHDLGHNSFSLSTGASYTANAASLPPFSPPLRSNIDEHYVMNISSPYLSPSRIWGL